MTREDKTVTVTLHAPGGRPRTFVLDDILSVGPDGAAGSVVRLRWSFVTERVTESPAAVRAAMEKAR